MSENTQVSKGVDFIVNSKRPYPEWIRNHTAFKEMNKIDKVFPKIGLPNFKEPCDIMNSAEATTEATRLGQRLTTEMNSAQRTLYTKLDEQLKSTEKDRNDKCAKIQALIDLLGKVVYSMNYNDYAKVVEGRVVLKLRADIFNGEKNPTFRKDEAILRVAGKLWESCEEFGVKLTKTDQYQEFKDFSRVNVPNKKYNVVFSSSGEEGAWDISTISMRGVTSCQSWNAPQSRGLIGSISSKFVGVIYLASEQEIPGYGTKMLNRCLVRFAINKTTRKPALMMDHMYPNANQDTLAAFKKVLKEKSGLEVYYVYDGNDRARAAEHYIPDEPVRAYYKQGETPYMDVQIEVRPHTPLIKKAPANITSFTDEFKKNVGSDLDKMIKIKKELFLDAQAKLEPLRAEYDAAKAKWEAENADKPEDQRTKFEHAKPEMDAELNAFGKGGVVNFLTHCDKKHGQDAAGRTFAKLILDSFEVPSLYECASKEEYHRKYLMTFLKNPVKVKEEAKKKYAAGTWMKSFPKSSERFFENVFGQMRGYVLSSVKEMIKKSN